MAGRRRSKFRIPACTRVTAARAVARGSCMFWRSRECWCDWWDRRPSPARSMNWRSYAAIFAWKCSRRKHHPGGSARTFAVSGRGEHGKDPSSAEEGGHRTDRSKKSWGTLCESWQWAPPTPPPQCPSAGFASFPRLPPTPPRTPQCEPRRQLDSVGTNDRPRQRRSHEPYPCPSYSFLAQFLAVGVELVDAETYEVRFGWASHSDRDSLVTAKYIPVPRDTTSMS
jgi:hypothetical protein